MMEHDEITVYLEANDQDLGAFGDFSPGGGRVPDAPVGGLDDGRTPSLVHLAAVREGSSSSDIMPNPGSGMSLARAQPKPGAVDDKPPPDVEHMAEAAFIDQPR